MEVTIKKITIVEGSVVEFFTAVKGSSDKSELHQFFDNDFSEHDEEYRFLMQIIKNIGVRGAKSHYFKSERQAQALPIVPIEMINASHTGDFGIRLFCLRLTDNAVLLLNGGIKTTQKAQHCPNINTHFHFANQLRQELDIDEQSGVIDYNIPRTLINHTVTI